MIYNSGSYRTIEKNIKVSPFSIVYPKYDTGRLKKKTDKAAGMLGQVVWLYTGVSPLPPPPRPVPASSFFAQRVHYSQWSSMVLGRYVSYIDIHIFVLLPQRTGSIGTFLWPLRPPS